MLFLLVVEHGFLSLTTLLLQVSGAIMQDCCMDRTVTFGIFLESYAPWWAVSEESGLSLYDTVASDDPG